VEAIQDILFTRIHSSKTIINVLHINLYLLPSSDREIYPFRQALGNRHLYIGGPSRSF